MIVKIFWQEQCPNCPPAKELGKKLEAEDGVEVSYHNIKDPDGLSEAVIFEVMSTPSIAVCDDNGEELKVWRGSIPSIDEIHNLK